MSTEPLPATDQSTTPDEPTGRRTLPPLGSDAEIRAFTPPIILEAQSAFFADLPEMLRERYGQWVAYHGKRRIGFGKTAAALWEQCLRQGYKDEELLFRRIWPEPETEYISAL